MSWSPAKPPEGFRPEAAVRVGSAQKSARYRPALVISVSPTRLDGGAAFLAAGARVSILYGAGEHAGMVRIEPGGPIRVAATGGKIGRSSVVVLRVALPVGVSASKRKPEPVEFDYGDDWIELTLPDWARATVLPARTAEPTSTPAPAREPYSISTRVPDPAAALRAPGARR